MPEGTRAAGLVGSEVTLRALEGLAGDGLLVGFERLSAWWAQMRGLASMVSSELGLPQGMRDARRAVK